MPSRSTRYLPAPPRSSSTDRIGGAGTHRGWTRVRDRQPLPARGLPTCRGFGDGLRVDVQLAQLSDLRDGSCVMGEEAVRSFHQEIAGRIEVDLSEPDPEQTKAALWDSLDVGMAEPNGAHRPRRGSPSRLGSGPLRSLPTAPAGYRRAKWDPLMRPVAPMSFSCDGAPQPGAAILSSSSTLLLSPTCATRARPAHPKRSRGRPPNR